MPRKPRLVRGKDYVILDGGDWQFTREYLVNLGTCCKNDCRFCPYREQDESCEDVPVEAMEQAERAEANQF